MRDMDADPYNHSERRVAEWILAKSGMGGGDDPVGAILASYDLKIVQMEDLRKEVARLRELLELTRKTCGRHNCNCPGSNNIRAKVDELAGRYGIIADTPSAR